MRLSQLPILNRLTKNLNYQESITLGEQKFKLPAIQGLQLPANELSETWLKVLLKGLQLSPGAAFMDVGVNLGQSMLTFRSLYDNPYWGFEPNPICLFYLDKLIEANHLPAVKVLPVGLGEANELKRFFLRSGGDSMATMVEDLRETAFYEMKGRDVFVPVFCFDTLQLEGRSRFGAVKIDVEGAELEVIKGMRGMLASDRPYIICEVLDADRESVLPKVQARANELLDIMKSLNYDTYQIVRTGSDHNPRYKKVNNIVLSKYGSESFLLNDYLFIPAEVRSDYVDSLVLPSAG